MKRLLITFILTGLSLTKAYSYEYDNDLYEELDYVEQSYTDEDNKDYARKKTPEDIYDTVEKMDLGNLDLVEAEDIDVVKTQSAATKRDNYEYNDSPEDFDRMDESEFID